MSEQVIKVFYNGKGYPYKDKERSVLYSIVGNAFQGASNTTQIRFYCSEIGGDNRQWAVIGKLPNGKRKFTILGESVYDSEEEEYYYSFMLGSAYTEAKGDLYLCLGGFNGSVVESSGVDTYELTEDSVREATGAIKLNIAYSTQIEGSDEEIDTWLAFLGALGTKLDKSKGIITYENATTLESNIANYDNGQMFYLKSKKVFAIKSSGNLEMHLSPLNVVFCDDSNDTIDTIFTKLGSLFPDIAYGLVLSSGRMYFTWIQSFTYETIEIYCFDLFNYERVVNENVSHNQLFANAISQAQITIVAFQEWCNERFVKLSGSNTIGANNTFNGSNVFNTSPQTNEQISDASSDTKLTTKKYVKDLMDEHLGDYDTLKDRVDTIEEEIPSQASSSNKLADRDWVNSTINSLAAFYITKNAQGDPFATYSELASATTFYSGGQVRVPTRNDYCLVVSDENHDNASCRYIYQGTQWEFQFVVNETPFTSDQIKAINSGITDTLVAQITTNANNITTINGKLPKIKDYVVATTSWALVNDKYVAELDAGVDFVIDDNAMKIYTPTSNSDQLLRDTYGINVSSDATTQKFTFTCNIGNEAPSEVINFTIAQFGG